MLTRIISLSITAALAVPLFAQISTPVNTVSEPTAVRELMGAFWLTAERMTMIANSPMESALVLPGLPITTVQSHGR
jgi:hypothetical protein